MQSQFVGFNTLKQSVSMTQVLDRYGLLERLKRSGDNLSGVCPVHHGHNPGQFRVSISKTAGFALATVGLEAVSLTSLPEWKASACAKPGCAFISVPHVPAEPFSI